MIYELTVLISIILNCRENCNLSDQINAVEWKYNMEALFSWVEL